MIPDPTRFYLRRMRHGDVSRVAAIDRLSFPAPWPPSVYIYELGRRDRAYCVLIAPPTEARKQASRWRQWLGAGWGDNDVRRIIGYSGVRVEGEVAHLSTIAIHPDWRGMGLGEALLLTAIETVLDTGGATIALEVRAYNSVAHHLYRKYGFCDKGVHRGYYRDGGDAWLMEAEVGGESYRWLLSAMRRNLEERLLRHHIEVGQNETDGI